MELNWLQDVARTDGPFATVYLDARHDDAQAAREVELRWRNARSRLAADGADEDTLRALDEAVEGLARAQEGQTVMTGRLLVAAHGSVLVNKPVAHAPDPPNARWSPLPHVVPALTELPEELTTVVAVVDGTGADIYVGTRVEHVDAERYPIHQARGGGLAHWSMRHRVWEKERAAAEEVAEAIDAEVAAAGAGLLVLAGEVQARGRVREALTGKAGQVVVETEAGGRAAGSDERALDEDVSARVAERIVEIRREAADRFERAAGSDAAAVEGVATVAEAFQAAQVAALYLDAGAVAEAKLWRGETPTMLATDSAALSDLGQRAFGPVDPVDALVCAAAASGAEVHPIGGGHTALVGRQLQDGVGAILRSADAARSAVGKD